MIPSIRSLAAAALLAACAPAAGGEGWREPGDARASDTLLTREEIEATRAGSLYEVVQRLRPGWLVASSIRSMGGSTLVLVYQNQTRLGNVDVLREMPRNYVRSIRYLDGSTAGATLPGIQPHEAVSGAIIVVTLPEPDEG